ncbi:hypothetical protein [Mycoplasma simbae]|uniref:hypothetical protein n=1 Tax=Mycoplasma simbae TaxID=36744 RepID=UPI0004960DDE|nr:hypothetical protein [Mycoplasma simbae]
MSKLENINIPYDPQKMLANDDFNASDLRSRILNNNFSSTNKYVKNNRLVSVNINKLYFNWNNPNESSKLDDNSVATFVDINVKGNFDINEYLVDYDIQTLSGINFIRFFLIKKTTLKTVSDNEQINSNIRIDISSLVSQYKNQKVAVFVDFANHESYKYKLDLYNEFKNNWSFFNDLYKLNSQTLLINSKSFWSESKHGWAEIISQDPLKPHEGWRTPVVTTN